jgi:alpha-amylase
MPWNRLCQRLIASLSVPQAQVPTPENSTLLQAFEWNVPPDGTHWARLADALPQLKTIGVSNIWIPPACKASGGLEGNGYDIYDLYDVGEFDQKGGRRTKWGDKNSLMRLVEKAKELGVGIYWDAVLNHKAGADRTETVKVTEVDSTSQLCLGCPCVMSDSLSVNRPDERSVRPI